MFEEAEGCTVVCEADSLLNEGEDGNSVFGSGRGACDANAACRGDAGEKADAACVSRCAAAICIGVAADATALGASDRANCAAGRTGLAGRRRGEPGRWRTGDTGLADEEAEAEDPAGPVPGDEVVLRANTAEVDVFSRPGPAELPKPKLVPELDDAMLAGGRRPFAAAGREVSEYECFVGSATVTRLLTRGRTGGGIMDPF